MWTDAMVKIAMEASWDAAWKQRGREIAEAIVSEMQKTSQATGHGKAQRAFGWRILERTCLAESVNRQRS